MTPLEYWLKYRSINVDLVNGQRIFGVDVHEYRNARDVFDKRNVDDDPANDVDNISADHDAGVGWHDAWSKLRGKIRKHGKKVGTNRYSLFLPLPVPGDDPPIQIEEVVNTAELASCFTGKGRPHLIATALRLAEAFGLVAPAAVSMNAYCSNYIGLDCNGFVGNYLKAEGVTAVGPSTPAKASYFLPDSRRLTTLDGIRSKSVLCWKNVGHVAIIDMVLLVNPDGKSVHCMVCESTGSQLTPGDVHTDGMNYTPYEIFAPDKHKVFKVKRGIGGSGLSEVYIGNYL